jgi:hypothetical protein
MKRMRVNLILSTVLIVLSPGPSRAVCDEAGLTDRDEMIARCHAYASMWLQTATDEDALRSNLLHNKYNCAWPHASDIYLHEDFLDQQMIPGWDWNGIPYAFGKSTPPDEWHIQIHIDNGLAIGNRRGHFLCNECQEGAGCGWAVGVDGAGALSYGWGVDRRDNCTLGPECGLETLDEGNMRPGCILAACDVHMAMFKSYAPGGDMYNVYEVSASWPVFRGSQWEPGSEYAGFKVYDSKFVADDPGSSGRLFAIWREEEGCVELIWKVAAASEVRSYEFQCMGEIDEEWEPVLTRGRGSVVKFRGPGTYTLLCWRGDAPQLVYRVLEIGEDEREIPYGETKAFPAAAVIARMLRKP